MIRLTELAVSKRSVTLLIALGMFFGGIFAWTQLNQELLPNIDLPIVIVVTPLPGAGATDVTSQVTEPVERAIAAVPGLEHSSSSSANSVSIVVAQFAYGTNVKDAKAAIDSNIAGLNLPNGAVPKVQALDINSLAPVTVAIQAVGTTTEAELVAFTQSTIVPAVAGVNGVSAVDMSGGVSQRLLVSLDAAKLAGAGVSFAQIQGVLMANNLTLPSGSLPTGDISVPVSTQHQFTTVDEVANLVVGVKVPAAAIPGTGTGTGAAPAASPQPGTPAALPTPIRLADLGTVQLTDVQASGYARLDSKPSVVLTISKTTDGNTVEVVDGVQSTLATLEAQYPGTFTVTTIQDLSTYIKESTSSLVREGLLGALFAVLVIYAFLLSVRSTLVAAVSIPLSIMSALVLMFVGGVTINIMTLGGLAVAVGRVVDDAIVVLENIYRHRGRGDPMRVAVISGTREVASAITSSTFTTVAVFLPLGFVGGIVSQFFLPFALTVTFALLASLVCALTVVPVLASLFIDRIKLNPDEGPKHHDTFVQRMYTPMLKAALQSRASRWSVIGIAGLLVVATALILPHIPTQFLNAGSEKYVTVTIAPPIGTPSTAVLAKAIEVETQLHANPEVNLIETSIPAEGDTGTSALAAIFTGRSGNSATINVRLDDGVDLEAEQAKLIAQLNALDGEGWKIEVAQQSMMGSSSTLDVVVSGSDATNVANATQIVQAALQTNPSLVNVKSDLAVETPEVQVNVDPSKATMVGTTTAQVQAEIHSALAGQQVMTVALQTGPTPLYLQINPAALTSVQTLGMVPVGAAKVPLATIATIEQVQVQARVTRVDQAPASTVTADIVGKDTGAVSRSVQKQIDQLSADGKLPGVTVTLSGVTEQMNTAFGGLFTSMAVAILLVYLVMVLVFNSLVDPLVIMFTLPLATIGAFPALYMTGRPLSISALIGFLMLIGIVVTNAIVLLDLVEQYRRRGMPMYEALIQGGRTRVRPILMTAIATILALIPLALGLNQGEIIASELATVVIGGLFSSTLLTLIVIPVVYALVEGGKDFVPAPVRITEPR